MGNPVFFVSAPVLAQNAVKGVLVGVVSIASFTKKFIDCIDEGVEKQVAFNNVEGVDWIVAVSVPKAEILAPVKSLGQINLVMAFAGDSTAHVPCWLTATPTTTPTAARHCTMLSDSPSMVQPNATAVTGTMLINTAARDAGMRLMAQL